MILPSVPSPNSLKTSKVVLPRDKRTARCFQCFFFLVEDLRGLRPESILNLYGLKVSAKTVPSSTRLRVQMTRQANGYSGEAFVESSEPISFDETGSFSFLCDEQPVAHGVVLEVFED